jgi:UDP-glucose 4-epimerase
MNILISGAAGFLGSTLLSMLPKNEYILTGYDLQDRVQSSIINLELIDLGEEWNIIAKSQPDIFIHAGAQTSVKFSQENALQDAEKNIVSTLNILEYITTKSPNTHFIYINSGGAIYGANNNFPIKETDIPVPTSFYGVSKLTVENYLKVYGETKGLKWSSLALSNVFGPGNKKGIFYEISKKLYFNQPPVINGPHASRDYIYIDDVVQAVYKQIQRPSMCRLNISTGIEVTNIEVFTKLAELYGKANIKPIVGEPILGEIYRSALSNERAKEFLDWEPKVDFMTGLDKFARNFIQNDN